MNMSRVGLTTLEIVLITIVLVVGATLSALLYTQWSYYTSLQSQYNALQARYSGLEANYTALVSKYQALKTNYTSLQSQYDTMESQYSSLQGQYSNVSSLLNGFVTSMSISGSESIPAGYYYYVGLAYVPSDCTVTGVLSVYASGGPVNVRIGDWVDFANFYAYNEGANYTTYTWDYEWSGTSYVSANVVLTTSYANGDYYILVIENNNPNPVTAMYSFTITHIYCPST